MTNQYKSQHWSPNEIVRNVADRTILEESIDVDGFHTSLRKLSEAGYSLHVKQKDRYSEHTKIVFSKSGKNVFSTRVRNLKDFATLDEILEAFVDKMNSPYGGKGYIAVIKPRDIKKLDPKTFEPQVATTVEGFCTATMTSELERRGYQVTSRGEAHTPITLDNFADDQLLTELSKRSESWAKPKKVVPVAEPKAPDNIIDFKDVFAKIDKELEEDVA
jgi:hypothetical protein